MDILCNLIYDDNKDIYSIVSHSFTTYCHALIDFANKFREQFPWAILESYEPADLVIFQDYFQKKPDKIQLFRDFIHLNTKETLQKLSLQMFHEIYTVLNKDNLLDLFIEKYKDELAANNWLLTSEERTYCLTSTISSKVLELLFTIKHISNFQRLLFKYNLQYNNGLYNNRALFKDAVMTYFYKATPYGRKNKFMKILEQIMYQNDDNDSGYQKDIVTIADLLEKFFEREGHKIMEGANIMFAICAILKKRNKPVIIHNEFFKIVYDPKMEDTITIETQMKKGKRGRQLNIKILTNDTDPDAFEKGFIANFIHSLDSVIAHKFLLFLIMLNKKALLDNIYIFNMTNHDNFYSSLIPFTQFIIEDQYLDLMKNTLIEMIFENLDDDTKEQILALINKEKLGVTRLNKNFVK
jgi:hypothetical protein